VFYVDEGDFFNDSEWRSANTGVKLKSLANAGLI
jgi:hypothetical protein